MALDSQLYSNFVDFLDYIYSFFSSKRIVNFLVNKLTKGVLLYTIFSTYLTTPPVLYCEILVASQ